MTRPRCFLIDGHALCYRSFYAIRELTASNGQPTNAVYGFVMALRKILKDFSPDYMAVCFDSPGKTRRQEKYAAYKIQRPSMPEDLISQIPIIHKVVKAFSIGCFDRDGYEADDLIAGLTHWAVESQKWDVVVVTEDKDLFQLAGSHVSFLSMRTGVVLDDAGAADKLGFDPRLIPDFLALAGDTADNIPGVRGIGKVTAGKLINTFGGLTAIYEHLEDVSPASVQTKLINDQEQAELSRELALLDDVVDVEPTVDLLQVGHPQTQELVDLFRDLEFRRLVEEYGALDVSATLSVAPKINLEIVSMEEGAQGLLAEATQKGWVALYIVNAEEGTHPEWYVYAGGTAVVRWDEASAGELAGDTRFALIVHDLKSSLKFLKKYGIVEKSYIFDTFLAGYLLGFAQGRLSIQDLAWDFLRLNMQTDSPPSIVKALFDLYPVMRTALGEKTLEPLLLDLEQPLADTLYEMEEIGVALDCDLLKRLSGECQQKIERMTVQMYELAGHPFNVNSPKQLAEILFQELKLPTVKKNKTGFSTNEEVLQILSLQHELPSLILDYRQTAKLKSTYIDALPKMINPLTGRIHAVFDQAGTETGRLSSRHPNLQNIPIRTEYGRQIRRAIIAQRPDYILLAADYSQIELRILAHLSGDEALRQAFADGEDVHRVTAARIFDIDAAEVDYLKRDAAKRVNFGIIYGMSAFGLAKDLKISQSEAQDFIDRYFLRYPKVKVFMDATIADCEKKGYVSTLLRRRRYITDISSKNMARRQYAQRQAINTPVQGSAADLVKIAMIRMSAEIKRRQWSSRLIMTVHDELVFETVADEISDLACSVKEIMEGALSLDVPIRVNMKQGADWLDMKEIIL